LRRLTIALLLLVAAGPAAAAVAAVLADSLALPPGRVTGLTWAGGDTLALLIAPDDGAGAGASSRLVLAVGDTAGTVYRQEDFTGILARGLAWDGTSFWSCGDDPGGGSVLYRIDADTLRITDAYPTTGHRPMDLAYDGRWLWLSDRDRARIDRIDPATGDVTRSLPAPGFSPVGLAWDGQSMWVTDPATGRLFRLRGARFEQQDPVAASAWFQRGRETLLAWDGRSLWLLTNGDSHLRRLGLE